MATEFLKRLETPEPGDSQPGYLARIATLPAAMQDAPDQSSGREQPSPLPDSARLGQIEHALTILASVVARLAREAQQSRLHLRATENDPTLQEERRMQRELVRSMQARLSHAEERIERQATPPESLSDVSAALTSIRNSLAALAERRRQSTAGSYGQ